MISAASERRQVNRTAIQSLSGAKPLKQGKNKKTETNKQTNKKQEQKKKVKMNIIRYAKSVLEIIILVNWDTKGYYCFLLAQT